MTEKPADKISFDWRSFTPEDSPKTPIDLLRDPQALDLSTPKLTEGDEAYGFNLPVFDFSDGVERDTAESFDLSAIAQEQPVALIFGSYT
jgi:hypothetical protein